MVPSLFKAHLFQLYPRMQFLHINSKPEKKLSRETWIEPTFTELDEHRHGFHAKNLLFLSAVDWDGFSHWERFNYQLEVEIQKDKDPSYVSPWRSTDRYIFKIDLKTKNILVVNTAKDVRDLFLRYAVLETVIDERVIQNLGGVKKDIQKCLEEYLAYLDALPSDKQEWLKDTDAVLAVIAERNAKKAPMNRPVAMYRKKTYENIADVLRSMKNSYATLSHLDKRIHSCRYRYIKTLDYARMRADGYNGLYYTQKLVESAETLKIPKLWALHKGYTNGGRCPMEQDVQEYIQWLQSDTLIVWNWASLEDSA